MPDMSQDAENIRTTAKLVSRKEELEMTDRGCVDIYIVSPLCFKIVYSNNHSST